MGRTYGHLLVVGGNQAAITRALGNDRAFLVAFDEAIAVCSEFAAGDAESAAIELSTRLRGTVYAFAVSDDQVLAGAVCRNGETIAQFMVPTLEDYAGIDVDELELMGEYLAEETPTAGAGSDPVGFALAAGIGDPRATRDILDREYATATDQYRDLATALGLPVAIVGWDFTSFDERHENFVGPTPRRIN